jgi:hypothetical protein
MASKKLLYAACIKTENNKEGNTWYANLYETADYKKDFPDEVLQNKTEGLLIISIKKYAVSENRELAEIKFLY